MKFRVIYGENGYRKRIYKIGGNEEITIDELVEKTGLTHNAARIRLNECTEKTDLFRRTKKQKTGRHYVEVEKNKLDNDYLFILALKWI